MYVNHLPSNVSIVIWFLVLHIVTYVCYGLAIPTYIIVTNVKIVGLAQKKILFIVTNVKHVLPKIMMKINRKFMNVGLDLSNLKYVLFAVRKCIFHKNQLGCCDVVMQVGESSSSDNSRLCFSYFGHHHCISHFHFLILRIYVCMYVCVFFLDIDDVDDGIIGHVDCLDELFRSQRSYAICPVCSKHVTDSSNMKPLWDSIRKSIEEQPLRNLLNDIQVGNRLTTAFGTFLVESMEQIITSVTDPRLTRAQSISLYLLGQGPLPAGIDLNTTPFMLTHVPVFLQNTIPNGILQGRPLQPGMMMPVQPQTAMMMPMQPAMMMQPQPGMMMQPQQIIGMLPPTAPGMTVPLPQPQHAPPISPQQHYLNPPHPSPHHQVQPHNNQPLVNFQQQVPNHQAPPQQGSHHQAPPQQATHHQAPHHHQTPHRQARPFLDLHVNEHDFDDDNNNDNNNDNSVEHNDLSPISMLPSEATHLLTMVQPPSTMGQPFIFELEQIPYFTLSSDSSNFLYRGQLVDWPLANGKNAKVR